MTTRTDIDLELFSSPRVLEVQNTSTEMVMQDLVDTARKLEDAFQGMGFKKLINASGKEDLGGGVKVGITVAMQNLLLAFAGRTTPAETGTVTGSPSNPIAGRQTMQDSTALFITNNVQRGSLLINFTDQSIADVVVVDSETQLQTKTLIEGIGNTYDTADVYKVWNIVQVNATGGNLTAVDEAQTTIDAVLPTAFTQVVLTSSASATLQEQEDIQFASFGGGVTVDVVGGTSGIDFPAGTPRQPVDNLTDALAIAQSRGFSKYFILGDITIPTGPALDNSVFVGESTTKSTITIPAPATVNNCEYENAMITGTLDGSSLISACAIGTLSFVNGLIKDSELLEVTITLGGGTLGQFINCWDATAGLTLPTIDCGGSGQALIIRFFSGGIQIQNKTGTEDASIGMTGGRIVVDNTVTTGDILLRGDGKWDNSATYTGGANVVNELVDGAQLQIMSKIMRNRMETNPITGVMTVYDDDDVTVLLTGNIYEDVLAGQIYRGRGMERRNRLT